VREAGDEISQNSEDFLKKGKEAAGSIKKAGGKAKQDIGKAIEEGGRNLQKE
jgi:hypothetical protein